MVGERRIDRADRVRAVDELEAAGDALPHAHPTRRDQAVDAIAARGQPLEIVARIAERQQPRFAHVTGVGIEQARTRRRLPLSPTTIERPACRRSVSQAAPDASGTGDADADATGLHGPLSPPVAAAASAPIVSVAAVPVADGAGMRSQAQLPGALAPLAGVGAGRRRMLAARGAPDTPPCKSVGAAASPRAHSIAAVTAPDPRRYLVKEMFGPTLQGEGAHAGRACVFLRFAACNLACTWCDTDFAPGRRDAPRTPPTRSLRGSSSSTPIARGWSIVTGGEPTLQYDAPLADALHAAGFRVHMETNGTRVPDGAVDWLTVSPKPQFPHPAGLALADGARARRAQGRRSMTPSTPRRSMRSRRAALGLRSLLRAAVHG